MNFPRPLHRLNDPIVAKAGAHSCAGLCEQPARSHSGLLPLRFVPAVPILSAAPAQGERAGGPSDRPALGPSDRPAVFAYLVVTLGVVLATVAHGASLKSGGHPLALLLFTFPLAYAAWCAGTRTSLLTLIVSVFVLAFANDLQGRSLAHDPGGQMGRVLFGWLGLVLVAMCVL